MWIDAYLWDFTLNADGLAYRPINEWSTKVDNFIFLIDNHYHYQ